MLVLDEEAEGQTGEKAVLFQCTLMSILVIISITCSLAIFFVVTVYPYYYAIIGKN